MAVSRAEHLKWAKTRALEYADAGDLGGAAASMISDLRKHPETKDHVAIDLMMSLLMTGNLSTKAKMRKFIEDFN